MNIMLTSLRLSCNSIACLVLVVVSVDGGTSSGKPDRFLYVEVSPYGMSIGEWVAVIVMPHWHRQGYLHIHGDSKSSIGD